MSSGGESARAARLEEGAEMSNEIITKVSSWSPMPRRENVTFQQTSTEDLRRLLLPIGEQVGREQLLALARNRWPCGYWVRYLDAK